MFAGFVARTEDTRLSKCGIFGELAGEAGYVRGQEKEWMGRFLDDFRVFYTNADQWTTAVRDDGGWRRTAEQGGGVSWRNASLQRKSGLDYGMQ